MRTSIFGLACLSLWLSFSHAIPSRTMDSQLSQSPTSTPSPTDPQEIQRLFEAGRLAFDQWNFSDALKYFSEAEGLAVQMGEMEQAVEIETSISWVFLTMGNPAGAMPVLEQAQAIIAQSSIITFEPYVNRMIAMAFQSMGEYQRALEYYYLSHNQFVDMSVNLDLPIEERLEYLYGLAPSFSDLGKVYTLIGDYDKAEQYLSGALYVYDQIGDNEAKAVALNDLGALAQARGNPDSAMEYYDQAHELGSTGISLLEVLKTVNNIGRLLAEKGEYDLATATLQGALENEERIGHFQLQARTLTELGLNERRNGDLIAATAYYSKAIILSKEYFYKDLLIESFAGLGATLEELGELGPALENYLSAVDVIEKLKGDLSVPSVRFKVTSGYLTVYQHAVQLQVKAGRTVDAFNLVERYRAGILLDSVSDRPILSGQVEDTDLLLRYQILTEKITEIEHTLYIEREKPVSEQNVTALYDLEKEISELRQDYEGMLEESSLAISESTKDAIIQPVQLHEFQGLIQPEETYLAYFSTGDTILVFIISADQAELVDLNVNPEDVSSSVRKFRELDRRRLTGVKPDSLAQLADWLIEPVLGLLPPSTTKLGIIPHLDLHYLPFSAMKVDGDYLCDLFQIFELPSASFLPLLFKNSDHGLSDSYQAVFMGGPDVSPFGISPLEHAQEEVVSIAELFGTEAYVGADASEANLRLLAPAIDLLHIAAHAEWRPDAPLFSRIWLSGGGGQDGQVNVYEVFDIGVSGADLIVLSGCETGVGYVNDADQAINLYRAFLPGARSVLASLWNVDDEATAFLFTRFYTYLAEGVEKAEALSLAQRDVRENLEHPEWQDPYFWGAFVLYGDPGKSSLPPQSQQSPEKNTRDGNEPAASDGVLLYSGIGLVLLVFAVLGAAAWRRRGYRSIN